MKETKPFNVHSRIKSFSFAFQGITTFFRTQHNAWIHILAAGLVISAGFLFHVSRGEWCMLIVAIALVFISEMLNTAVEFLADMVSPEFHPLVKKAKDVAAGAVLVASVAAIGIGMVVFVPKFF